MIRIGQRIQHLREQKGLSQRALAEAAGISPSALSLLEAGRHSPSVATLEKLADALGVSVAAFFTDASEERPVEVFSLADRPSVKLGGGSLFVPLTAQHRPVGFEPMLVHLEPGGMLDERQYGILSAQAFVWVRRGRAVLEYEDARWELAETQSAYYDARRPHNWRNPFDAPCELLIVRSR